MKKLLKNYKFWLVAGCAAATGYCVYVLFVGALCL